MPDNLWDELFKISPVLYKKPVATLYELLVSNADLELIKEYLEVGHASLKSSAGNEPLGFAVQFCDPATVEYMLEHCPANAHNLYDKAIIRIEESAEGVQAGNKSLEAGLAVLDLLIQRFPEQEFLAAGFISCAMREQFTAAKRLLAAGLADESVRTGAKSFCLLSERLQQLQAPDYADLLLGKAVDEDKLRRNENKNRKQAVRLRTAMQDLVPFASIKQLQGEARADYYAKLVNALRDGLWDKQLDVPDPHFKRSIMEFAAQYNLLELFQSLQARPGFTQAIKTHGYQAAVAAATGGHLDFLKALQSCGVNITATPKGKNSPLSEACRFGQAGIVDYLLAEGASPRSSDGSGHNFDLLDLAGGVARGQIVAALQKRRE